MIRKRYLMILSLVIVSVSIGSLVLTSATQSSISRSTKITMVINMPYYVPSGAFIVFNGLSITEVYAYEILPNPDPIGGSLNQYRSSITHTKIFIDRGSDVNAFQMKLPLNVFISSKTVRMDLWKLSTSGNVTVRVYDKNGKVAGVFTNSKTESDIDDSCLETFFIPAKDLL